MSLRTRATVLTISTVSLTTAPPATRDLVPGHVPNQQPHVATPVAVAPVTAPAAFAPPTWQDDSGSEHSDDEYYSDASSSEDYTGCARNDADDALFESIIALLRDHSVIMAGNAGQSMAWERDGDDELVEYVVGPMRAQLLREVDAKVRIIGAKVRFALAVHRASTLSF